MADDPLVGLGAPLPLGPDLRARLEEALLAGEVPLLDGLDAPLPLPPALRASLEARLLVRGRSRGRRAVVVGVAAAALVGGLLLLPRPASRPPASPRVAQEAGVPSWQRALAGQPERARTATGGTTLSGLTAAAAPSRSLSDEVLRTPSFQLSGRNSLKAALDEIAPLRTVVVAPATAPIGTTVELRGPGLGSAGRVLFGTTPASAVRVLSENALEVPVPAGIGTVDVRTDTGLVGRFTYP